MCESTLCDMSTGVRNTFTVTDAKKYGPHTEHHFLKLRNMRRETDPIEPGHVSKEKHRKACGCYLLILCCARVRNSSSSRLSSSIYPPPKDACARWRAYPGSAVGLLSAFDVIDVLAAANKSDDAKK